MDQRLAREALQPRPARHGDLRAEDAGGAAAERGREAGEVFDDRLRLLAAEAEAETGGENGRGREAKRVRRESEEREEREEREESEEREEREESEESEEREESEVKGKEGEWRGRSRAMKRSVWWQEA
jgi:hypothetical protein